MAEVKWIKLVTDFFDDEKIRLIEEMPDADMVLIIWIKLLTLAGKKNQAGYIYLTEKIPYTDEMLATIFRRPLNTIRLALSTFKKLEMIDFNEAGIIKMINWEKHQNIEGMAKLKAGNTLRKQNQRSRQYLLENMYKGLSIDGSGLCAYCGENSILTLDHIIPVAKGGLDVLENYELVCLKCNKSKGNRDLSTYLNELVKNDKNVIQKVINNKKIISYIKYEKGVFIQKNIKLAVTVTPCHTIEEDKIRIDEIRRDKKEREEVRNQVSASLDKKPANDVEFDQELLSWYGIDEDIYDDWVKRFPTIDVPVELMKIREYFKDNPEKAKEIEKKFEGRMPIYINDWLERAEKYKLADSL